MASPIPRRATAERYTDEIEEVDNRIPLSTVRRDRNGNQVIQQGNRRIIIHDDPPPKKRSVLLPVGMGMLFMILLFSGVSSLSSWWANYQLNATYGMPRTYQADAIVYPGDSAAHPSHYIFLNLNGTVIVTELQHGDPAHSKMYKVTTLFSDNAASIPVTGEFKEVNNKIEMLIHISDQTIIYVNDGTQFKPQE